MFVIPRLFPGHDGMAVTLWIVESSILKPVDCTSTGLLSTGSVVYSSVSPSEWSADSAIFLACASADSMPIFQPVSLAARRAFWPSLPMARDSWSSWMKAMAVLFFSLITCTPVATAGDSAAATNFAGSADQSTISIFSGPRFSMTARTRLRRGRSARPSG